MSRYRSATLLFALLTITATAVSTASAQGFRISEMGPPTNDAYFAFRPTAAYNPDRHQYLVAWIGSDDADGQLADEAEVFIQILDAATGEPLLPEDRRISSMGGLGNADFNARLAVAAAYNDTDRNFLVAWTGDDDRDGQVDDENEVFIQLVDAATGELLLADEQRISDMYGLGNPSFDAADAAVAYNRVANEFLVVWVGQDSPQAAFGDNEVFVQRLDGASGRELGINDHRISAVGGIGAKRQYYLLRRPAVAHDPEHNVYLVAWEAFELSGFDDAENVIMVQRVDGLTGLEIAPDDDRISATGPHNLAFANIDVAYNPDEDEFLVVWPGKTLIASDNGTEFQRDEEIFAQAIDAVTGAQVGADDRGVSAMGGLDNPDFEASNPSVAYNSARGEYLVVWAGSDLGGGLAPGELEIFGRWLGAADDKGSPQFRISSAGGLGDADYLTGNPEVASADDDLLVVWWGNDDAPDLDHEEFEIFGRLLVAARSGR